MTGTIPPEMTGFISPDTSDDTSVPTITLPDQESADQESLNCLRAAARIFAIGNMRAVLSSPAASSDDAVSGGCK